MGIHFAYNGYVLLDGVLFKYKTHGSMQPAKMNMKYFEI